MGCRFLDHRAAGAELGAPENVASAHDNGQLHAALHHPLSLPSNVESFINADATLTPHPESIPADFQHNPGILGNQRLKVQEIFHGSRS